MDQLNDKDISYVHAIPSNIAEGHYVFAVTIGNQSFYSTQHLILTILSPEKSQVIENPALINPFTEDFFRTLGIIFCICIIIICGILFIKTRFFAGSATRYGLPHVLKKIHRKNSEKNMMHRQHLLNSTYEQGFINKEELKSFLSK